MIQQNCRTIKSRVCNSCSLALTFTCVVICIVRVFIELLTTTKLYHVNITLLKQLFCGNTFCPIWPKWTKNWTKCATTAHFCATITHIF